MPPPPPAPSPGGARGGGGAVTPPPSNSKPQSPLRIAHEGEFYARLLTRESSAGNPPSFRYYGAGTGAVPFVWESQPGTPKDAYSSSSRTMLATAAAAVAPVITPPPSYYLRGGVPLGHSARRHGGKTGGGGKYFGYKLKWVKVSFIATVFRRLAFGKSRSSSSAASVKSSSSSTRWLFSGSGSVEAREQECCGYYDDPAEPRTKGVLCLGVRASPWMVQFCSGQREQAGWVYGWRP
ncbi:hypothetical protein BDA96_09G182000 [Sorghum bicolor]|uniref:Uncharacterized protein n=1 Tax=Sorghum bicolor TaxID=4558 RepID=A0A921QCI7_SORBI|nr:hypothetical protein BDA96_09G182000 [Sorghum bicolor]